MLKLSLDANEMNLRRTILKKGALLMTLLGFLCPNLARPEAMLQLFNVSWPDLAKKMPELAEAGYTSLWLPPPTKGSGGLSVGYDCFDGFDLGSKIQSGSYSTRYGTEADLLHMVEVAHRFGIRVYFDNIMNHRAFGVPGSDENTPIDLYPGMVPEDFHLQTTEDGFYQKWGNTGNWGDGWEVQNLGLSDLIDIAHETPNANFGSTRGKTAPKYTFVRHPNNPEYYDRLPNGTYVGFGTNNGITPQVIAANPEFYKEDVGAFLIRNARWLMDRTKADGLRLDAVKHVPDYFFGKMSGADKNSSNDGYTGGIQWQFNQTRGFNDPDHRDSLFDVERPRNDAMLFGEHLGTPPGYGGYVDAGMRLVDNELRTRLNNNLGNPGGTVRDLEWSISTANSPWSDARGFAPDHGVMHANSHDNDYAAQIQLQHAIYYTRAGLGLVYSDGNTHAEVLSDSSGAFPRHANTRYLGQNGDPRIPNLAQIHGDFARGFQWGLWSDTDGLAYERRDNRNPDGSTTTRAAADDVTMVVMLNDNTASGKLLQNLSSSFPSGAYLHQYARGPDGSYQAGFEVYAGELGTSRVIVPAGGYYVFSYLTPELSTLWQESAITFYQNGSEVPTITTDRKDGPDGDAWYNPYGLANRGFDSTNDLVPFTYRMRVPVVRAGSPLTIVARADGSAENILLKLDGGVDLNGTVPPGVTDSANRDNPPGWRTDVFLGYEQPNFVARQHPEKFAAANANRCKIGSPGAETFRRGTNGVFQVNPAATNANDWQSENGNQVSFAYHDPNNAVEGLSGTPPPQFNTNGSNWVVWAKTPTNLSNFRMFIYYTTNGTTWPEGAGGLGRGQTKVAEMNWRHDQTNGNTGSWWSVTNLAPHVSSTEFRYKIGVYRGVAESLFPADPTSVAYKRKMLTTFTVTNFNPSTVAFHKHNDHNSLTNGLADGFHVLRARAFLKRDGKAPLYRTFTQTFYYDAETPRAEIAFPAESSEIGGSSYEMVLRTDPTVTEVWAHIDDTDPNNDDLVTQSPNGNGRGGDPFVDTDGDGLCDPGETFTDLDGNGIFTANSPVGAWTQVSEVAQNFYVSSPHHREFRFRYKNLPASNREPWNDSNNNNQWDAGETFTDLNGNGSWDANVPARVTFRLLESSSVRNFTLDPATGRFTELTRTNLQTRGPDMRMTIAWPQRDRDTVGDNYEMKVYLSAALADGLSHTQILSRMSFSIASKESASDQGAVDQPLTTNNTTMNWGSFGAGGAFRELAIRLPNLYNDLPDFLHRLRVTYADPLTGVTLEDVRLVKAWPTAKPSIAIATPSEKDSNGQLTTIQLDDLPGNDRLRYTVEVQTSLSVTGVTLAGNPSLILPDETYQDGYTKDSQGNPVAVPSLQNGKFDAQESFLDANNNQVYDAGEIFTDLNGNNAWDANEQPTLVENPVSGNSDFVNGTWDGITVESQNTSKRWKIPWMIVAPGNYLLTATGTNGSETATATRMARVILRQPSGPVDEDSDNDGLTDINELTSTNLPTSSSDTWSNGSVHVYYAYGKSLPTCPDSDGDGLPDGLEVGWRNAASSATDLAADTNGDGFRNFIGDLDPPLYNVAENNNAGVPGTDATGNITKPRERKIHGSVTDPMNPDTDGDGLPDGIEDANRNGWTDGDGKPLPLSATTAQYTNSVNRPLSGDWPNDLIDPWEATALAWKETSPTNPDSDGDGLNDGFGEDNDLNGRIGGDINTNRVYDAGEAWTETDPLRKDTDGDGLPDGWEVQNKLSPLDNGTDNLKTAAANDGSPANGANGNPDNDLNNNLAEFNAGTDPNVDNTLPPVVGSGTISIGSFSDWKPADLLVLDEYGTSGNVSDIYRSDNDGYGSSRDLVAVSMRDGGDSDGRLYFRADFLDLQANAQQGFVDFYLVINLGNAGNGEKALPDQVELTTTLGWQAIVAVFGVNSGTLYVDTNPAANTENVFQNPTSAGFGVQSLGVGPNGLIASAWSSTQDALEFSISRQALKNIGWTGDVTTLRFQAYTTKDGTATGTGEIGGRHDLRDTIGDDWITSDYWKDSANISANAKLTTSFGLGVGVWNDRGKAAKVLLLGHANEALQPASHFHNRIKNGSTNNAPGYSRWLAVHEATKAPVSLHLTATLASGLQWAASSDPTKDGPAFNTRIKAGVAQGWLDLLGTTFADHVLRYFPLELNRQNVLAAREVLDGIYGAGTNSPASSRAVFWPCERVLDHGSLEQLRQIGFTYTFADQSRHLSKWFGRTSALGQNGYRINQVNGMRIIPIHDATSDYLAQVYDAGATLQIRQLLSRRARSGIEDQVVTLWRDLGDMLNETTLSAYEANVRWLVNRPWVQLVTATDIAAGRAPYKGQDGGTYTVWGGPNHGTNQTLALTGKDWIDYATQNNYDNWYHGSPNEEGLKNKRFLIRSGATNALAFGQPGIPNTISDRVWTSLSGIETNRPWSLLARATLGASLFQTAFHNTGTTDLSKFSTGDYMNPDAGTGQTLADFARISQAQTREAALYGRVQQWATNALSTTLGTAEEDVDLDGEKEYLLFNTRIFAVFEASGGRMTAAWMRNPDSGKVRQVVGNLAAYANTETEDEGNSNVTGSNNVLNAYRTSGFKDWWVVSPSGTGSSSRVNSLYTVAPDGTNGWTMNSQDGVTKTIRLTSASSDRLTASYSFSGQSSAFIRFGLSPHLENLMIRGQSGLGVTATSNRIQVANVVSSNEVVRASIQVEGNILNNSTASINTNAIDTLAGPSSPYTSINMRNQAQTQQVEVALTGEGPHIITLGFDDGTDAPPATDGILDSWWEQYGITGSARTANGDFDGDGVSNLLENRLGSKPNDASDTGLPSLVLAGTNGATTNGLSTNGFTFSFPTVANVTYQPVANTNLSFTNWANIGPSISGDGNVHSATDSSATNSTSKFYRIKLTPVTNSTPSP